MACPNGSWWLLACDEWLRRVMEGDCGPRGEGDNGLVGVPATPGGIPARFIASVEALVGVRLRLKDEDLDRLGPGRGVGVGELKVCPVGSTSSL